MEKGMNGHVGPNGIDIEVKDATPPEDILAGLRDAVKEFEEAFEKYKATTVRLRRELLERMG